MRNSVNSKEIIKFAGTYISVAIGSGFATGQEVLQFFSVHGLMSIGAGIISMALFSFCGASLLELGYSTKFKSNTDMFINYCGKYLGRFFKWFTIIFMFSSFVVMISGAGATINQYYGINQKIGSLVIALIVVISVFMGINKVINILGNIGPIIIIFSISIGLITLIRNFENLGNINYILSDLQIKSATNNWFTSGVLYASFNITLVAPFLVEVGSTATNKKNCVLGGIIGGCAYMIAAMILNLGLLSNIQNVYNQEIPTLILSNEISKTIGVMFSINLIAEIYTTATPLLLTVCKSFFKEGTIKFKLLAIIGAIVGFLGGSLPFGELVNFVYPFSGAVGLVLILGIIFKKSRITNIRIIK